ncbi:anti-sigma factor domain-containing protein [Neobacillus cucumis]|uniref:anti-sigma factor domain-containing protein n=1 Tax=Neobacillus cucumis TaxID=1740721 RepID=UPI002041926C|nr:anti-sigma factor domain-containing protein [Neobacillus cucumis]MCM3728727.1 anti-sigma factor domain-containing protein [Neobacillus cucumis]
MKKGIIMEIDDAFITLLTPEGEFLRTKKQDQIYMIGEEIHFFPMTNVQTKKSLLLFLFLLKNIFTSRSVLVVIAALIISIGSFLPLYQNNKAYAYMSIDANSSIELGLNKKMQVVKLTGINKAGKEVISELKNWKKKDVSKITQSLLAEMKQAGLLEKKQPVIISTVPAEEQDEQSEKDLQKTLDELKALAGKQKLDMTVLKATQEDRKQAQNRGISTGKYQYQKKGKEKKKNAGQKNVAAPSRQLAIISPRQQKKLVDNQNDKKNSDAQIMPGDKKIPPGQLKKVENQIIPNHGDNKQQQPKQQQTTQPAKQTPQLQVEQQPKQQAKQQPKQQAKQQPKQQAKQQPKQQQTTQPAKQTSQRQVKQQTKQQQQAKQQTKNQPKAKNSSVNTANHQQRSKQKE